MVHLQKMTDETVLAEYLGFQEGSTTNKSGQPALLGLGVMADPEQIMARYPMRISQVAEKLGLGYWYKIDQVIKQIAAETGFNLKNSNNNYHIDVGIKQSEHRYSMEAVDLFSTVMKKENYKVVDSDGKVIEVNY